MLLRRTSQSILAAAARIGLPQPARIQVQDAPDPALGDVATNYPLVATKEAGKPPMEIAELLAEELRKDPAYAEVTAAKPGFVNLTFATEETETLLAELASSPFDAPTRDVWKGRTLVMEYGGENIAKPMSVGHLRSNIIGMACARLARALGATVIGLDYNGDWGTQFGKLVVAYRTWGDEARVRENPIDELVALYQRFSQEAKENPALDDEARATFHAMEFGTDAEALRLWQWFAEESRKEYRPMKKRLNVEHDVILSESTHREEIPAVYAELIAKGVAVENEDGSAGVTFPNKELPSIIARKSDGSSLYLTRDLATLKFRLAQYKPDELIYFIADQQTLYLKQVFRTAELLGWSFRAQHAGFGMVLGEHGKVMSTREGTAILLREVVARAEQTARAIIAERGSDAPAEEQEQVARDLATAAIMYNDLSQNRTTTIVFDWDKMLAFEGDTAPYLLYAVARARSIEEKAQAAGLAPGPIRIQDPKEAALARELLLLHDRIALAAETLKPNLLAEQLYRIAQAFSSFYADLPILTAEPAVASSRLALALLTKKLLRSGLDLLGIPRVERM